MSALHSVPGLMRHCVFAGAAAFALLGAAAAQAQYPDRPIRAIVPFSPGGANDIMGRLMSPYLGKRLGQTVVVENMPGAGGHIGIEAVVRSKPDGHTILYSATASTVLPALTKEMRYDPVKDIQPVAEIGQGPYVVFVNPKVPANNLRELIEHARKNPGKVNSGAGGRSGTYLAIELLKLQNNLDLLIVSYKGNGPTVTAVVRGEVDFAIMDASAYVTHLKAGRVKALAVAGEKRLPSLPDVPTSAEAGYPDLIAGAIFGVYVAAGTPAPILQRLNAAVNETIVMPEVTSQLRKLGAEPSPKTVDQFTRLIHKEIQTWKDVVAKAKIPVQ